ncbi:MAG TPA: PilZ domain-containing protein [Anaeromyxobacteraceae bacterium]|nr:PilZ domain-containing protein [Anaeromyxobacteraceae bacterium]
MAWWKWLGKGKKASRKALRPRPTPRQTPPSERAEEIPVEAEQLPLAWRAATGRLVVTVKKPVRMGKRAAVKVSGPGSVMAPLTGAITNLQALGSEFSVEIKVDEDQRAALKRMLKSLQTGVDQPRARASRYQLRLPAVVSWQKGNTYMTTFSVSRGGCGLAWSGEPPPVDSFLQVRLGSGKGSAMLRARVCWVTEHAGRRMVGVQFVAGQEAALMALITGSHTPAE